MQSKTLADIMAETEKPVVAIDEQGFITFLNPAFERSYGWSSNDLVGQLVTRIMPPHMRDAHNFGFSRFLVTEAPRILNQPLQLPVSCKDGTVMDAEHFIVGENVEGKWRFAATISRAEGM